MHCSPDDDLPPAAAGAPLLRIEIPPANDDSRFLRVLLDNLSEGIVACDEQGQLRLFNRASREFHGLPPQPGPAEDWGRHYSLYEADGRTPLATDRIPLVRAFSGETVSQQRMVIAPAGLPARQMTTNAQPIYDEDGRRVGAVAAMRDVTELLQAERRLSAVESLAQVTLGAISDGVIRVDTDGRIDYCNPAALGLLRVGADALLGACFDDVLRLVLRAELAEAHTRSHAQTPDQPQVGARSGPLWRALHGAGGLRLPPYSEIRSLDGDHSQAISGSVAPILDRNGRVHGAVLVFQDARYTRASDTEIEALLRCDALTGMPNRLACEEHLRLRYAALGADALARQCLVFIDFDHFRIVNHTCGAAGGDRLLVQAAEALARLARAGDFIARVGGDQFALVTALDGESEAAARIQQINAAFDEVRFSFEERECPVGINLGLIRLAEAGGSPTEALARAEAACDLAKERDRGRPSFYAHADSSIQLHREFPLWVQRIRAAFDGRALELYFERIVTAEGRPLGYEGLIRMRDPGGQLIMPAKILPVIRKMGWGIRLDQLVVSQALSHLAKGAVLAIPEGQFLSINISSRSLSSESFGAWLLDAVATACGDAERLPHHRFHIEITETDEMTSSGFERATIAALRRRGVSVWLDDFGAGYNSFEPLKRIEIDGIKIDRAFTRNLQDDPVGMALVRTTLALSAQLGFGIVAEGIEDSDSANQLAALGITQFQGWLFHRASPASEALLAA